MQEPGEREADEIPQIIKNAVGHHREKAASTVEQEKKMTGLAAGNTREKR